MSKPVIGILPKVSFQTSYRLNLFWHVMAKYGDVVPINPSLMSAVRQKYKIQNAGRRNPLVTKMLREMAYQADDWAFLEAGFRDPSTANVPFQVGSRYADYGVLLQKSMELESDSFRLTLDKEIEELGLYQAYLDEKWEKYGEFVLNEYSRIANESWSLNKLQVYLVTRSLNTGIFRRDYLILPYCRNFDQGFCVLLHLLARFLVTNKVLDILYQHTGPSQDLYLDAIYGLLVNHVLLNVTKNWPDFKAPVEPLGGLEFKIFRSLLPFWREHLQLQNESFDTFLKRRISEDFIPVAELGIAD
ncbi:MAG TPA: hypothetical protein VNA15_09670 [Candidatus Angelobacter sp.]|nr:hypothetical protein [Candidatus Angelobacter sp.]